jgi:hypothetical protein
MKTRNAFNKAFKRSAAKNAAPVNNTLVSMKINFRIIMIIFGLLIITACSAYKYSVSAKQDEVVKVGLWEISRSMSSEILHAYFGQYPYDEARNKDVFFLRCEVAEKCQNQIYTMVWTWAVNPMLSCSQAVGVFKTGNGYKFEVERERCLF